VRENLQRDPSVGRKHAVYDEMRAKGLTDYVAWPLYHTLGKRHMVTFATDRPEVSTTRISPACETVAGSGAGQRNPYQETGWRERCSKPMSGRMPANSFWPAPPGAEAGRRCARPS